MYVKRERERCLTHLPGEEVLHPHEEKGHPPASDAMEHGKLSHLRSPHFLWKKNAKSKHEKNTICFLQSMKNNSTKNSRVTNSTFLRSTLTLPYPACFLPPYPSFPNNAGMFCYLKNNICGSVSSVSLSGNPTHTVQWLTGKVGVPQSARFVFVILCLLCL